MANLSNNTPQALTDWRNTEENQNVFQKLLEDLDNLLDSLRARMNELVGNKDGKASAPPCLEDQEHVFVEGQDVPDKKPQFLPEWSPGRSPGNTVQKRYDTGKEDRKKDEKDLQTRCEDNDGVQKVKYVQWSMSEIKEEPELSQFLLRWPPEGSVFVRSGSAEPHHS